MKKCFINLHPSILKIQHYQAHFWNPQFKCNNQYVLSKSLEVARNAELASKHIVSQQLFFNNGKMIL